MVIDQKLTERVAKTRWCPFALTYRFVEAETADTKSTYVSVNRGYNGEADGAARCIASACMAWQWVDYPGPSPDAPLGRCGMVPLAPAPPRPAQTAALSSITKI